MARIDGFTRLHPQKNTERITQATKSSRWLQQAKGRTNTEQQKGTEGKKKDVEKEDPENKSKKFSYYTVYPQVNKKI